MNLPADVANQALDAIGVDFSIGDLQEGTKAARVLLRHYGQCLRQLLRSAHWNFARNTAPLVLLADATGQTRDVGRRVPVPWVYEYEYPVDCEKVRFVPWNGPGMRPAAPPTNIQIPNTPLTAAPQQPLTGQRLRPARFTVATDFNYPPQQGQMTWNVQGVSPQGRTVILTDVRYALCVYTKLVLYPSVWDSLFREAMVAYLGQQVAMALHKDKKFALQVRRDQIAVVKEKLTQARMIDGNEGWYSSDIPVDWMEFRNARGWGGRGAWGAEEGRGMIGYGWEACVFADGSAY